MASIPIQFGSFSLQSSTVTSTATDVYSPPKNNVQAEKLAGSDGAVIVRSVLEPKTFRVEGYIRGDTREQTEALINAFNTAVFQPNQAFDIEYGGDTRRYVSTVSNVIISTRGTSTATFSAEFICPTGVGSDTYNSILLSPTVLTTSTGTFGISAGGTYLVEPLITLTVIAVTGGTSKRISITNGSTLRGISITRNWIAGDKIELNTLKKTIYVNNAPHEYLGQFPTWTVGPGVIAYSDDFTTRSVSVEAIYVRRWL